MAEGRAKLGHVVAADAGDGGDFGLDDVGAVEAAAQAGFDDAQFDLLIGEIFERDGGEDVEISRRRPAAGDQGHDRLDGAGKIGLGDHLAVDADALANIDQMGAGIKPDGVPGGFEHGGDHGGSAAFSFGAGDMDAAELVLWVSELAEEGPHAVEVEIIGVIADDAEALVIAKSRQKTQGFGIGEARSAPGIGAFFEIEQHGPAEMRRSARPDLPEATFAGRGFALPFSLTGIEFSIISSKPMSFNLLIRLETAYIYGIEQAFGG